MNETGKRPYRRAEETRQHVLDVAARLFYNEGIHAVGVDRIAAEAGVTTATLYRLFGSKEGLVCAYLQREDRRWFARLERTVQDGDLVRLFEELDEEARSADSHGCRIRMALAEYPDPGCAVYRMAVDHRARIRARFREVAAANGHADPDLVAEELLLILDGISASAAERTPDSPPGPGPRLVRRLLATPAQETPVPLTAPAATAR